jgi:hypothetical protein
MVIYSEHLPKFLALTTFFSLPIIFITTLIVAVGFMDASEAISKVSAARLSGVLGIILSFISIFCSYLILGTTTWIVAQNLAVPLRPIRLRPALKQARAKWKTFAGTGIISTILPFIGAVLSCGLGYPVLTVLLILVAPIVMMENLRGFAAMKRSAKLVLRSPWTAVSAIFLTFIIPALVSGIIALFVWSTVTALEAKTGNLPPPVAEQKSVDTPDKTENPARNENGEKKNDVNFSFGKDKNIKIVDNGKEKSMASRLTDTIQNALIQILWMPMQIVVLSFTSIIFALLYLKTRQTGGESMDDLLGQFESVESPDTNWQKRVRERLLQSGRITGRSHNT